MEYNVHMKAVIAIQENIMSSLLSILLRVCSMSKQQASFLVGVSIQILLRCGLVEPLMWVVRTFLL